MDPDNLLSNLAIAFDTSNHKQSQNLIKKIIDLAAKKLNPSNNSKPRLSQETQQSIDFIKRMLNKESQKPKRKFISKKKLRRIAIKRIATKNRTVHERFIKTQHQKQFKIDRRNTQTSNISIFSLENEQHKLQSAEEDYENLSLYPQNSLYPISLKESKDKKQSKQAQTLKEDIKQKFKKTRKNFQTYLESNSNQQKADEITCPVCIQILVDPVSTICGHSFCFRCLDQSLLFGSNCPVCRLFIKGTDILPCKYLQDLIRTKLSQFLDDKSAIQTYQLRKKQNNEWKISRFINPFKIKPGDVIDVRDTQHIWCKAKILKIFCLKNNVSSILVHYQQWAKIYDEVIEIKSNRLAPKDIFSSRTDIPRYNLGNEEQNLRGAVITGNNNEGSFRNAGNELVFSNIMQLNNLRNRISSLQNNVINEFIPMPMLQRNRQVSFLHHIIQQDSNEPVFRRQNQGYQESLSSGEDEGSDSSLGSFVFRQPAIYYDRSEFDSHEMGSEIGQPAQNQEYISIHDSSNGQNDEVDFSQNYWNTRPIIQVHQMQEDYQEQNSEVMQFLSPFYGRANANSQNHIDADEYSFGANSDSH